MKKLNNKGLTLVELIVSFALVSVAMLYFYQTVSTVSKLYKCIIYLQINFLSEEIYKNFVNTYFTYFFICTLNKLERKRIK